MLLAAPGAAQPFRAFWADAYHYGYRNPAEIEQLVTEVVSANANVIIAEVRRSGQSFYLKSVEPPVSDPAYSPNFDALAYLIDRAHARGIQVHAWFPVTPLWPAATAPADPRHLWNSHGANAAGNDMWMTVSSAGKASTSVDPGHPGALGYLADLMVNVARDYDVDGIHLDYIRYPEDADYGWNPVAVERFNRTSNRTGSPAPRDAAWSAFRRKQVTDVVRQVYLRTYALKPRVAISAATITWGNGPSSDADFLSSDAYSRVFQDWRGWLEEGIVDIAIPMNYFAETRYAPFLDRWLEFEKNRQYRRAAAVGLGNYLNSIPESMAQMQRVLAPSAAGNRAFGVAFYSYASTNTLDTAGAPVAPNANFYQAVAQMFGSALPAPDLPWKAKPERGHAYGWLRVDGGADWMRDGATVWIVAANAAETRYRAITDGTGFHGVVDLPPGAYYAALERGGIELTRTAAQDLKAGGTIRFDFVLKPEDFGAAIPAIDGAPAAAPGDIVVLRGRNLGGELAAAPGLPLPVVLGGTQVLVNGAAAQLLWSARDSVSLLMPMVKAAEWNVVARRDGMESARVTLPVTGAHPVITGVRVDARGFAEIYATGLGLLDVNPPAVSVNGQRVGLLYAGLAPGQVGVYQIDVPVPDSAGPLEFRIEGGEPFRTTGVPN